MIKVVAKNIIKQDKIDEFIALAKKLVDATNHYDNGCIHYELYQDTADPRILTMIEEWEGMEALKEHMEAPHFKEIVPQFSQYADGPEEVHLYQKI